MRQFSDDALQPLRTALLAAAHREADATLAAASLDADSAKARAGSAARDLIIAARRAGEVETAHASARDDSRVDRQVRAIVLSAQHEVYVELARRTRLATRALRDDPEYCALRAKLEARARRIVGDDCVVTEATEGGIVATAPGRVVRMTLDDLADWALASLADAPAAAWST